MATTRSAGGIGLLLAGMVLIVLLLCAIALDGQPIHLGQLLQAEVRDGVELPPLSPHALEHGQDAVVAWEWVESHGRPCRWDCPDGRTRYICGMPRNIFAIVVVESGDIVTAFTGDQDYASGASQGCWNGWHASHP